MVREPADGLTMDGSLPHPCKTGAGKVCLNQKRAARMKGAVEAMLTNEIVLAVVFNTEFR